MNASDDENLAEYYLRRAKYCRRIGRLEEALMLYLKLDMVEEVEKINEELKAKEGKGSSITIKDSVISRSKVGKW